MTSTAFDRLEAPPGFRRPPVLAVPLDVWQKMMAFVLACPVEVNGFGYLDRYGDTFSLADVFILEQTASPAGVEVSAEALHRHLYEMTRDGIDGGRMRFQWHSHVNMTAYFSGIDLGNIEHYVGDWMVSLVANKYGDFQARLDVLRPFRVWTPVQVNVTCLPDTQAMDTATAEISAKVRQLGAFRKRRIRPGSESPPYNIDAAVLQTSDLS